MPRTLYDKLWDYHIVTEREDGTHLLYIDRHLIHEVTSPQAFEGLRIARRKPWRVSSNKATPDHNIPTTDRELGIDGISDEVSKLQITTLDNNCKEYGIEQFDINDKRQGIVHVVGPEQGITLPGMTIVCGDSHTSTHGALGALAMGIGTTEVEHVLATQCLVVTKLKNMKVDISGKFHEGVYSKDLTLSLIGQIGTAGATGHAIEYTGEAIKSMSIEARMTVCNMSIEAGARAGMIAFDEVTFDYVKGKPYTPIGDDLEKALIMWNELKSDEGAHFDKTISLKGNKIKPQVSWGTSPEMVIDIDSTIPEPRSKSESDALLYMDLQPGMRPQDIKLDQVFIGSCTNSRLEDLRIAANLVKGNKVNRRIKRAIVVPGSGLVASDAEKEGLDEIFKEAGFQWRAPGCSMCLGMNPDQLDEGDHCASTSNRNFEGRQGYKGRTHLVSPATAAVAALAGHFVDVREVLKS